jgi:hypothetical protein
MEVGVERFKRMCGYYKMFERFTNFEYEIDGEKVIYDLESHVTRSFRLYNGYVLFEQTSPFTTMPYGMNNIRIPYYNNCISNNAYFTQKILINLNSKTIEYIDVKAHTFSAYIMPNLPLDLDVVVKFSKLDSNVYESKVNELISYVKEKNSK